MKTTEKLILGVSAEIVIVAPTAGTATGYSAIGITKQGPITRDVSVSYMNGYTPRGEDDEEEIKS